MLDSYNLFDLHCDTALRIATDNISIADNEACHISLKKAGYLKRYVQVFAIFAPKSMSNDDAYFNFIKCASYLKDQLSANRNIISGICKNGKELSKAIESGKYGALLAIEDARIINNNIDRIDDLCNLDVRFITPVWWGESCIGGAHNTDSGLTNFGKLAVKRMSEKNIVIDISHASEKTADNIISIVTSTGGKAVATHSNSASVYNHSRNLRDRHFYDIKTLGGLVGISLCPEHLTNDHPDMDAIIRHIDRYMELGGEDILAIGTDFDGTDLPDGFSSIADIYKISDRLSALGYSNEIIGKIFFYNAFNFSKLL